MSQKVKTVQESYSITGKALLRQLSRYLATGFLSVGIEFSILLLLVEVYAFNYLIANCIAFTVTNICTYFLSRHWVFEKGKHERHIELIAFFITSSIGLGINQGVMGMMVGYLAIDYRISKVVALGLVTIWNFWARKKLVFKG